VVNFARNGFLLAQARATALTEHHTGVPSPLRARRSRRICRELSAGSVLVQVYLHRAGSFSLLAASRSRSPIRGPPRRERDRAQRIGPGPPPLTSRSPVTVLRTWVSACRCQLRAKRILAGASARDRAHRRPILAVPFPLRRRRSRRICRGCRRGRSRCRSTYKQGPEVSVCWRHRSRGSTDTRPAPGVSAIAPQRDRLGGSAGAFTISVEGCDSVRTAGWSTSRETGSCWRNARDRAHRRHHTAVPFPSAATANHAESAGAVRGRSRCKVILADRGRNLRSARQRSRSPSLIATAAGVRRGERHHTGCVPSTTSSAGSNAGSGWGVREGHAALRVTRRP